MFSKKKNWFKKQGGGVVGNLFIGGVSATINTSDLLATSNSPFLTSNFG
mgnify:CR=1 FL=1